MLVVMTEQHDTQAKTFCLRDLGIGLASLCSDGVLESDENIKTNICGLPVLTPF